MPRSSATSSRRIRSPAASSPSRICSRISPAAYSTRVMMFGRVRACPLADFLSAEVLGIARIYRIGQADFLVDRRPKVRRTCSIGTAQADTFARADSPIRAITDLEARRRDRTDNLLITNQVLSQV